MNISNTSGIRPGSPITTVLERIRGAEPSGKGYKALCPAHDDHNPSLSISEGKDARVLLKCHAGCDIQDIVGAIGLEMRDLFSDVAAVKWSPHEGVEAAIYPYVNRDGSLSYQVVRYEMRDRSHPAFGDKTFRQRAYCPNHPNAGQKGCPEGFAWGRKGAPPLLYRFPRVIKAVERGECVYIVEGEKDVETLEQIGVTATCCAGGACSGDELGRRWSEAMMDVFAGANVVCLPDNDAPGREYMEALAPCLVRRNADVRIIELPGLPKKGDVTDWLNGDGTLGTLETLVDTVEPVPWVPETAGELVDRCAETADDDLIFNHIALMAALPLDEYAQVKQRLKAATGVNLNDLEAAVQEARAEEKKRKAREATERRRTAHEDRGLPTVQVSGRQSSETVYDMTTATENQNDPPTLFRRNGELVRLTCDDEGRSVIESVSEAFFDDFVARSATYVDQEYRNTDFSLRHLRRVQETVDAPILVGITRIPVLRPDGSIHDTPGYDVTTNLFYEPISDSVPPVSLRPSTEDVKVALETIKQIWIDHPFADSASLANALALVLTPVVLPLLGTANVPLAVVSATRAGAGKSLLAEMIGTAGTGQTPATMSAPGSDDEVRKQITALLRGGERFVVIDDLDQTLDSAALRRAITSPVWSDRLLGSSRQVRLPSRTTWVATGNNLRPTGDMIRRSFLIRLDTGMAAPHLREGFTHLQPQWTRDHRAPLAAALLTLVRHWISEDRPSSSAPTLGSFERWCTVVGGILEAVGVDDFLGNLDKLRLPGLDDEGRWGCLLRALETWQHNVIGKDVFTVRRLVQFIEEQMQLEPSDRSPLATEIADHLPDEVQRRIRRGDPFATALGNALASKRKTRFPEGLHVSDAGSSGHVTRWSVRRDPVEDLSR